MEIKIYNQQGEEAGTTTLPEEIFAVKMNPDLIHQVAVSQMANRRRPIAHTKDRGEVRGGGRKPWPQKHMGRARHGSIRSPLWRKGGVTFGPTKERIFKKKIPLKMKRKALFMALSSKIEDNFLIILDKLKLDKPKTKLMAEVIKSLREKIENFKKGKILIILPEMDKDLILASRNIADLGTAQAKDLNVLDLLSFKYLILLENSIKVMEKIFKNQK